MVGICSVDESTGQYSKAIVKGDQLLIVYGPTSAECSSRTPPSNTYDIGSGSTIGCHIAPGGATGYIGAVKYLPAKSLTSHTFEDHFLGVTGWYGSVIGSFVLSPVTPSCSFAPLESQVVYAKEMCVKGRLVTYNYTSPTCSPDSLFYFAVASSYGDYCFGSRPAGSILLLP